MTSTRRPRQRLLGHGQCACSTSAAMAASAAIRRRWRLARVKEFGESDSGFAWQLLAGVYAAGQRQHRYRPEVSLLPQHKLDIQDQVAFTAGAGPCAPGGPPCSGGILTFGIDDRFTVAQPVGEPDLQLRRPRRLRLRRPAAAPAAASAASGDADVPGWFGDPGDGRLSGRRRLRLRRRLRRQSAAKPRLKS